MMKHGGGHGRHADRDLNLTAEQARVLVEARLIMRGNDRLKVGEVSEMDAETYLVDVVTLDDSTGAPDRGRSQQRPAARAVRS